MSKNTTEQKPQKLGDEQITKRQAATEAYKVLDSKLKVGVVNCIGAIIAPVAFASSVTIGGFFIICLVGYNAFIVGMSKKRMDYFKKTYF